MNDPSMLAGTATLTFLVGEGDTAISLGSGDLPVLATPRLIAWCEAACCAALQLDPGRTSVGTRVEVEHVGAVPVGSSVTATATASYHDGRLIRFDVVAEGSHNPDGDDIRLLHGTMTRVIVDRQRFMARLA